MKKKQIITAIILVVLAISQPACGAADAKQDLPEIIIDDFADGLDPAWTEKSFVGRTLYVPAFDGRSCIRATSNNSASGLYYKISYDPKEYPFISWAWKIDNVLAKGNGLSKSGDDYAARIYVIFPSIFFWKTRVINYIWANKIPRNTAVPNSYTANAMMVAVESGPEMAGEWLVEKRNVLADYRKYFGSEPGKVGAIAIMTDTDDTGEIAAACYGAIRILAVGRDKK